MPAAAGAAVAGAGDFDPTKHSCPHPLPLADERLRWYFARRDVNEAATKASFPALGEVLSPCLSRNAELPVPLHARVI